MRILYIDIDSLRPDHLGCYGYGRDTSPNIDRLAGEGVVFDNVHASDAPCMPSRTSLFSGRFGIHHGCVSHTGTRAEPFPEGTTRQFRSQWGRTNWMRHLRDAGEHPRNPASLETLADVKQMVDGYDVGIRYTDQHVGQLLGELDALGVLDETAVIVSADHGENLGELNSYGGHCFADQLTTRVPLIIRWPGVSDSGTRRSALHYHIDLAATVLGEPPEDNPDRYRERLRQTGRGNWVDEPVKDNPTQRTNTCA